MQDHRLDQLPPLSSIVGEKLLPWQRLWCPLGGPISMDGYGFDDARRGFLAQPTKYSNSNCKPLSQWIDSPAGAWVLCGSPGTGKSGAIRRWLDDLLATEPETALIAWTSKMFSYTDKFERLAENHVFKQAQAAGRNLVVVIDGFDQFRTTGGLPWEGLAACLSSIPDRSRIRLVIGCRVRDWNQNEGQALLNLWPASEQPRVLEICPLTRADAVSATEARGKIRADAFLSEVFGKRLEAAAHWPLPLRSLLDEYAQSGQLPDSVMEMISRTIDQLLRDPSAKLAEKDTLQHQQSRQCARRLAAVSILGGYQAMSRGQSNEPGILPPEEFMAEPALAWEATTGADRFPVNGAALDQLFGSALFTPVRQPTPTDPEPAFGFTHQSYAEFLAAEYLRALEVSQLRSLFTVVGLGGERVPGQLVETASWLAVIHPSWFEYLVSHMPEILLRCDGTQYSNEQKQRLTDSLLLRVNAWDAAALEEVRLLTPAFSFPGLADCLRPIIISAQAHEFSLRFAIQVAEQCRLSELEEELWTILERRDASNARHWATSALHNILRVGNHSPATIERLKTAMRGEMGPDDDDDLKGMALKCLVPKVLKPREVVPWLTLAKKSNYFGTYEAFLDYILPDLLEEADIEAFLHLGAATPSIFHVEFAARNLKYQVLKLFAAIKSQTPGMKAGFAGWVRRCGRGHTSLPMRKRGDDLEEDGEPGNEFDESARCSWLKIVIEQGEMDAGRIGSVLRALHLMRPPLEWVLKQLNASSPERRHLWAEAVKFSVVLQEQRAAHKELLIASYEQHAELRAALIPCVDGLDIHESYLARAKEGEKLEKQYLRERKSKRTPLTRREWFERDLKVWRDGNELAWLNLWKGCALREDGQLLEWGGDHVEDWKGWQALSTEEQSEIRACARAYLIRRDDPRRGSAEWTSTVGSDAGAYAVGLLADQIEADQELANAVRDKWAATWVREFMNVNAKAQRIAAVLHSLNSKAVMRILHECFQRENEANHYCRSIPLLENCWNTGLSAMFAGWLSDVSVKPVTLRTGIEFLAKRDSECALSLVNTWLCRVESGAVADAALADAVIFCAMEFTGGALFERAFSLLGEPPNARRILCLGDYSFGDPGPGLSTTLNVLTTNQLGRLVVLMARAFPEKDDGDDGPADEIEQVNVPTGEEMERRSEGISRPVTASMSVYRVSSAVMARFAAVASPEELEAVRQQLPDSRRIELPFTRNRVLKQAAQAEWEPVPPAQTLRLIQKAHACFIRSNDDLLEFVLQRLNAFASQPWNIGVKPLWNEPYGLPPSAKEEEELSNRLKIWLDHDLQLIVNREVQPVELIGKRLDLKIEIPGEPRLCVIVEVKKVENAEVESSMQTQLVDTYLVAGRQTHGIYAVGWFGDKPAILKGATLEGMNATLDAKRAGLNMPATVRVEYLLMDFRHPNPEPKLKKKRSPKSK